MGINWAAVREPWMDDRTETEPKDRPTCSELRWIAVANVKGRLWWERVDVILGGPCRAGGGQLVTSLGQELSPSYMRWCPISTNCRKQLISLVRNHNSIHLQLKLVPEWIVK